MDDVRSSGKSVGLSRYLFWLFLTENTPKIRKVLLSIINSRNNCYGSVSNLIVDHCQIIVKCLKI